MMLKYAQKSVCLEKVHDRSTMKMAFWMLSLCVSIVLMVMTLLLWYFVQCLEPKVSQGWETSGDKCFNEAQSLFSGRPR
jgi:nitric oxide reductase large subunit